MQLWLRTENVSLDLNECEIKQEYDLFNVKNRLNSINNRKFNKKKISKMEFKKIITELIYKNSTDTGAGVLIDFKKIHHLIDEIDAANSSYIGSESSK